MGMGGGLVDWVPGADGRHGGGRAAAGVLVGGPDADPGCPGDVPSGAASSPPVTDGAFLNSFLNFLSRNCKESFL